MSPCLSADLVFCLPLHTSCLASRSSVSNLLFEAHARTLSLWVSLLPSLSLSISVSLCMFLCLHLYLSHFVFFSPVICGAGEGGRCPLSLPPLCVLSVSGFLSFKAWKWVCLSCRHLLPPKPTAAPPCPLFSTLHLPPSCLSVLISGCLPQPSQFSDLTSALSSRPSRLHLLPRSLPHQVSASLSWSAAHTALKSPGGSPSRVKGAPGGGLSDALGGGGCRQ